MVDPESKRGATTTWRQDVFESLKRAQSFSEGFLNLGIAAVKVDFRRAQNDEAAIKCDDRAGYVKLANRGRCS